MSDEEISHLPSIQGQSDAPSTSPAPSAAPSAAPSEVFEADEVTSPESASENDPSRESQGDSQSDSQSEPVMAQVLAVPRAAAPATSKRAFPILPVGIAGLLIIGALYGNATRSADKAAVAPALAPTNVSGAAPATQVEAPARFLKLNSLALNSDFELGTDGWKLENKQAYVEGNQRGARSGTKVLTFWGREPYSSSAFQTIKNLPPGRYTLRAWVRRTGGQEQARLVAKDMGGARRTITMPVARDRALISLNDIQVTDGKCTIGFETKSQGGKFTKVDAIEFRPE